MWGGGNARNGPPFLDKVWSSCKEMLLENDFLREFQNGTAYKEPWRQSKVLEQLPWGTRRSVDYQGSLGTTQFGPNKARKSTYLPHSEQQQSASPDRFDGAQGDQRWIAVAGPRITRACRCSLEHGFGGPFTYRTRY